MTKLKLTSVRNVYVQGDRVARIASRNEHGEFMVRLSIGGVVQSEADYFTNDREDAEGTAQAMVEGERE